MIQRHSEYVLLQNAECDVPEPRDVASLRAQLATIERSWASKGAALPEGLLSNDQENFARASLSYRMSSSSSSSPPQLAPRSRR